MNFFGHAVVALWSSDDRRFVLGSMLPDLCSMLGIRGADPEDAVIAAGVDFHHQTDAAFHGCERFVALCARTVDALTTTGVGRGTSRAVAHVGTELLLDGMLSRHSAARESYTQALAMAVDERLSETLETAAPDRERMHHGLKRLLHAPVPEAYLDPTFVLQRLRSMLAPRPRLAMQPRDEDAVRTELRKLSTEVSAVWPELLDQVRARL